MRDEADLLAGVFHFPRPILTRGEGSYVWDTDGRRYLDFTSGLGVAALGHGRADLADALREQFATLGHCSNLYGNLPAIELAQRLIDASFAERVWYANSGTEANEAALKFARLYGRRVGGARKVQIVAFRGGFHGRTMGALSATYHPEYRAPFSPLVPGIRFARLNDLESVKRVMSDRTCAVIVEPVQGEGGVIPADAAFLRALRALCDEHQALLIFDEVQCGLGRTGHLWAYQGVEVTPDLLALAKPIAAGLPLGAVLIGAKVTPLLEPGQHGSTFSGGPAACALGVRVFDALSEPGFLVRVRLASARLQVGLEAIASRSRILSGARGRGLMQAVVVKRPRRSPPGEVVRKARERGLLLTRAGDDAVRLLPPLNCSDDEIAEALGILEAAVNDMAPRRTRRSRQQPTASTAGAELAVTGGVR